MSGVCCLAFFVGTGYDGRIDISHLQFADEISIFYEADPNPLRHLCCLFLCFEAVSHLKINLAKSKLVPIDNVNNVEGSARILGYRVSSLSMKYLGLPLGASFKAKSIWVKRSNFT